MRTSKLILILAVCRTILLVFAVFATRGLLAQIQPLSKSNPVYVANAQLARFGASSGWLWGIQTGRWVLLSTSDEGRSWSTCTTPRELTNFIEAEDKLITGSDQNDVTQYPLSTSFSNENTAWISWIVHASNGLPTAIVTAHSSDRCQTWNIVSAEFPELVGSSDFPANQYLKAQFVGINGWALLFEDPATAMCPGGFVRTTDGGRSWKWIASSELNKFPSGGCPVGSWNFRNADEGWLTRTNPYDSNASEILWRTTDGGATWMNLSKAITLPPEIKDGGSIVFDISVPAFSSANTKIGTLAILYTFCPSQCSSWLLAIYRTNDDGSSWRLAKSFPRNDDAQLRESSPLTGHVPVWYSTLGSRYQTWAASFFMAAFSRMTSPVSRPCRAISAAIERPRIR